MSVRKSILKRIEAGLNDQEKYQGRQRAIKVICKSSPAMVANYPNLSQRVRSIKEHAIHNMDKLLAEAVSNLKANGCKVYLADTAVDAREYLLDLLQEKSLVVKSKSNVGKEVGVTHALEELGCEVVETDLGDCINQLANSKSAHPMAPAIHFTKEKVAQIFSKEIGRTVEPEIPVLVQTARQLLREKLLRAEVGISGANAIAAEEGIIFLEENEGNIRAVTSLPPVHIVLAGINKIVPGLDDALAVVRGAAVYGAGQDVGTYVSGISGPGAQQDQQSGLEEELYGPREVHVVLIDNGRRRAVASGFGEALYCINCGSCLNFCPVYREVGEEFGSKYLGGIGVIQTALMEGMHQAQEAGLSLCLSCKRCVENCPNEINTPEMIARLRARVVKQEGLKGLDKVVLGALHKSELTFFAAKHLQSIAVAKAKKGEGVQLRRPWLGIGTDKLLPRISDKNLRSLVAEHSVVRKPKARVVFFPGCFIEYLYPNIGEAVIDVLNQNQVEVVLPPEQLCCGAPHRIKGDMERAEQLARKNVKMLSSINAEAIIVACATCGSELRQGYIELYQQKFFSGEVFSLAAKVFDISEYLSSLQWFKEPEGMIERRVTYHDPCHLCRWQGVTKEPRELLHSVPGLNFVEMDEPDSCCGAAGTFCFNFEQLAINIQRKKVEDATETAADLLATGCPMCILNLKDGFYRFEKSCRVMHTIEILSASYKLSTAHKFGGGVPI